MGTKASAPNLAFVMVFTSNTALGLPTVAISGPENPPQPILTTVRLSARLVIAPAEVVAPT